MKTMVISVLIFVVLVFSSCYYDNMETKIYTSNIDAPNINVVSAIVFDLSSGKTLYKYEPDIALQPGSLVKLLTVRARRTKIAVITIGTPTDEARSESARELVEYAYRM